MKVKFTGPGVDGVFAQAVADRAQLLGMDGWVRVRGHDGSVDALFAGDCGGIQRILEFVRGADEGPASMVRIDEKPLRGDEPIWTEFHLLPPT
ncbi:acylphosphatase [Varunaivibrio sulfuroxidans]|nr:acylphosphatase [Varunaivibrio sulfuroxidans]WES30523.1 acylphosphatase [Varunaivibrio sulfuroxidans]